MILKLIAAALIGGTVFTAGARQQTLPAQNSPSTKVLFSRSDDQAAPQSGAPALAPQKGTSSVTDAERSAIRFTAYDLDVHLSPRDHAISALAKIEIRNAGAQPLSIVPLQLSSSLNFEGVSLDGKRLPFTQQTINSDTDHTGQLHEAAIQLPAPLAPNASLRLEAIYSGAIEVNAKRLLAIGTPDDVAAYSDWDRISEDFTGLRGFGDVIWYPVASVPALLGDGDKVFAEIGSQKLNQSSATVSVHLTIEYFLAPPAAIVIDGHSIPVPKPSVAPTQDYPGVITCSLTPARLGFATPSIFLAYGTPITGSDLHIYARGEDQAGAQHLVSDASTVQPLVSEWLGEKPKSSVTVIDLPEPQDLTWEQGTLLLTSINDQPTGSSAEMMSHALAHAYFQSPREWLNEGVAGFLETLWIAQTDNRTHALEKLESQRNALAMVEPASPGEGPGEDLLHASAPVYYRTKSTYVLWMLRDVAGEKELASALQSYSAADDTSPDYFQKLVEQESGKNLQWFFDNWVYHDRGLPDLSIAAFHSSPASVAGEYIAAVDIMNDGFAEAEVPVTVRSTNATLTERVLLPGKTRTIHRMLVLGIPNEVIVNDGTVPEVAADIHQREINSQ